MGNLPVAALAFGIALAAAPIVLWMLRRVQVLDLPSARSLHESATPRSGGLAPAAACVVAGLLSSQLRGTSREAIVFVSVSLGLIGLVDDLHTVGFRTKLLGQVTVAVVSLIWLTYGLSGWVLARALAAGSIVGWLVGFVNAFNFMDGINGLSVAQVLVAGVTWAFIGSQEHVPTLVAAGLIPAAAVIAFAPFNVPRARMFLGDVGSYFLGGWLAATAVIGLRARIAPEAMLAPLAVYLADTGVTLVRRLRRHEIWWQPHREHAYQRLVQSGWSHSRTTVSVGLIMAAASALGALSLTGSWTLRAFGDIVGLAVLAGYVTLPSLLARDVPGSDAAVSS